MKGGRPGLLRGGSAPAWAAAERPPFREEEEEEGGAAVGGGPNAAFVPLLGGSRAGGCRVFVSYGGMVVCWSDFCQLDTSYSYLERGTLN